MTERLEDLLTKAVRERAVAYALLADARADAASLRAERDAARLDAAAALYVVVDIGCIECAEPSAVLGVFTTEERARAVADAAEKQPSGAHAGQHHFEVFAVDGMEAP